MKFCQAHWDKLREAVYAKGMRPLVPRSGAEGAERLVEELSGEATDATYDPLMSCFWMICVRAMDALGSYLLSSDYCPVCEVVRAHGEQPCPHGCSGADVEERWIHGPVDAAYAYVQETPVLRALLEVIS